MTLKKARSAFGRLILHTRSLQLRDKIACLHLLWNGDVFKNMIIYIDLVPAFKLPDDFQPERSLPLTASKITPPLPHHAIAKASRHTYDEKNNMFSYSFALHENVFIENLPTNIRRGYMRAKSLRTTPICCNVNK